MAVKEILDPLGFGLTDQAIIKYDALTGKPVDSSIKEKGPKVVFTEDAEFAKGAKFTGGSVQLGLNTSLGESASALIIRDKQGRNFTVAQNVIGANGSSPTFVARVDPETTTIRQGSDTLNTIVGSIFWFDIVVDDQRLNEITFRAVTGATGARLVVRENDALGDIVVITEEDDPWESGDGFTLTSGGDSVIPLISSVAFFDGAILHFTLEVFTGTFDIKGDILAFGGQPSAFVPYFASKDNTFNLQLMADGGGFNRRLTGDVAIAAGTNVVVGTGTLALTELAIGESIQIREENFTVATITDNLNWTLSANHIVGAGAGIGGGLNAIVFAEVNVLDVKNFDGTKRLVIDRLGSLKHTGDRFETSSNYIIKTPNLIGTNAQTLGTVEAYQKTSTTSTITAKQFTAGDTITPIIQMDSTGVFSSDDIVLIEGTKFNDGYYEIAIQLGGSDTALLRGIGGAANVEDWTDDQITTAVETGIITKVKVSVRRTSLTGTIEHGEGSVTPIIFFRLAHADDVPIVATEEFANTDVRFFSELGLPATQGATDNTVNAGTITIISDNVLGVQKDVIKYDVPGDNDVAESLFPLTAANWTSILTDGTSYSAICRIEKDENTQSIFSGMGFSAANDPRPSSIQSRVGIFISVDATHTTIRLEGQAVVILDGTGGVPLVLKDEWFLWEVRIEETPDAGVNFGAAKLFVNDILVVTSSVASSNNAVNDIVSVQNSSSSGSTTFFFDNFGATIYEEGSLKTLSAATMLADIAQIFIPGGRRDYTVVLPDGNPRKIGNRLDFIAQNVSGKLKLKTENTAAPQVLFNGLNEVEKDVTKIDNISLTNTIEGGNVYVGEFEEVITYDHSGLISSGIDDGPKGMSIVNSTTFRIEPIKAVIVDRSLNTFSPSQRFIDLPQTDHIITGGGDQVVNVYITKQGTFDFRAAEPTSFAITGEIFIGKAVMAAGVITVAVFTPNVAYTGTVDGQAELINGGGHKTKGSLLSAAGANLTIGITLGNHHQIGRGFIEDPNSPNLCETAAIPIIAFTGTTGNLFLVHADAVGAFIIDSFISNSATPDIDPAQFNNAGTLATVPVNDVTAQRVFQACGTNDIIIYYGTTTYANMAAAEAGFEDEAPELLTTRDISYICTILVKETVTDLTAGVTAGDVIFKNRSGDREL